MPRSVLLAAALLSALYSQPAQAEGDGTWSKAGNWIISMSPGDNCAMLSSFGEDWIFGTAYSADRGVIGLVVGKLPYKVGDTPALSWEIGDAAYSGGQNVVTQVQGGTRVAGGMDDSFVDKLAAATAIDIYDNDTDDKIIGFNLTDTAAAVSELRRCLGELIKEDKGSRQPAVTAAKPLNLATLIESEDYPASALRDGIGGRTGVALTVTAHGVVSDCAIISSSGRADLDDATCRIMRARAKFSPATDAANQPTEGRHQTAVVWNVPND